MSNWKRCEDWQNELVFCLFSDHWLQKRFQCFAVNQSIAQTTRVFPDQWIFLRSDQKDEHLKIFSNPFLLAATNHWRETCWKMLKTEECFVWMTMLTKKNAPNFAGKSCLDSKQCNVICSVLELLIATWALLLCKHFWPTKLQSEMVPGVSSQLSLTECLFQCIELDVLLQFAMTLPDWVVPCWNTARCGLKSFDDQFLKDPLSFPSLKQKGCHRQSWNKTMEHNCTCLDFFQRSTFGHKTCSL